METFEKVGTDRLARDLAPHARHREDHHFFYFPTTFGFMAARPGHSFI
jgi:hypothetical protein